MTRTSRERCYECGSTDMGRYKGGKNFYCYSCDTVFYTANSTVPEGTPYYCLPEMNKMKAVKPEPVYKKPLMTKSA